MRIETGGRDPSLTQYVLRGVLVLVVFAMMIVLLMMRYQGTFDSYVKVKAQMGDVGDGLISSADVRYNGYVVGAVKKVDDSTDTNGKNVKKVTIWLDTKQAKGIPANVTARAVPSNLFGVNSVEFVPPPAGKESGHLKNSSKSIQADNSEETLTLQDAQNQLRTLFTTVPPEQIGKVFTTLGDALKGGGGVFGNFVGNLEKYLNAINDLFPAGAPPGFNNFNQTLQGLHQSAPQLLDTLAQSIKPAQTVIQNQRNLIAVLNAGQATADQVQSFFAKNGNVGQRIMADVSVVTGALVYQQNGLTDTMTALRSTLSKLLTIFTGTNGHIKLNLGVSFTPMNQYTKANCPVYNGGPYGIARGPGCTGPGTGTGPGSGGPLNVSPVSTTAAPGSVTTADDNQALQSAIGRKPSTADTMMLAPIVGAVRAEAAAGGAK